MAQHPIILGQYPGDKKGDPARVAGGKINLDIGELYALVSNLSGLNLVAGPVTKLAPGANPTASLTGTAPNYTLNLGLPEGAAGAGAPNSADILAIARRSDLIADLRAIGITETPTLIADFIDDIYYADRSYIGASVAAFAAALPGSAVGRSSVAHYVDSDRLMKSASINVLRLDHDPVTGKRRGLLAERWSTNLISRSMLESDRSLYDATLTPGTSAFADGSIRMSRLTSTIGSGSFSASMCDVYLVMPNDAETYTFSTFLRPGTSPKNTIYMAFYGGSSEVGTEFTVDWGSLTVTGNGRLQDCGGGLYRASVTLANNGSGNTQAAARVYTRTQGAEHVVGEYVDVGGWQFENGLEASSFIETTGSAATRSGDAIALGPGFWASPTNTVYVEIEAYPLDKPRVPLFLSESTGNFGSGVYLVRGSVDITLAPGAPPANLSISFNDAVSRHVRMAARLKTNDAALSCNGAAAIQDASCTIPTISELVLGSAYFDHVFGAHLDGHLRRAMVFPAPLSDTELALLSALNWRPA